MSASLQPSREIPADYELGGSLDLSKNRKLMIALNIAGALLLFLFAWLFLRAAAWLRPAETGQVINFEFNGLRQILFWILALVASQVAFVVLHEAIHGLFFWLITREKPAFGFRGAYAFAAAPQWYIPRNPYLIIGLAPLVLISVVGVLLIPVLPGALLPFWLLGLTFNAAGAVGDLAVVIWLLGQPASSLINDRGDAVTLYRLAPRAR